MKLNNTLHKIMRNKLIGTKIGSATIDDIGRIRGRWVFYYRAEDGSYCWDWLNQ